MEKTVRILKSDSIILLIIIVIGFILGITSHEFTKLNFVAYIICFSLALLTYIGAKKYKRYAGICGSILSILLIISLSIIDIVIGIFMLIHSIKYLKNYDYYQNN